MHKILDEKAEIVKVINSNINKIPFIISIPHSGLYLTSEMNEKLRKDSILANMDWYIPELYSFLEKRVFNEEEYPTINNNVMNTCQKKLRKIFCNISKIS